MPSIDHPEVLGVLVEHLTLGGIFRLDRALGRAPAWPPDVPGLVATRMSLAHPRRHKDMGLLRIQMSKSIRRCAECGAPTRRVIRVCDHCRNDPDGWRAIWTRVDIVKYARRCNDMTNLRRRIAAHRMIGFGPGRCYLYWKQEVMSQVFGL